VLPVAVVQSKTRPVEIVRLGHEVGDHSHLKGLEAIPRIKHVVLQVDRIRIDDGLDVNRRVALPGIVADGDDGVAVFKVVAGGRKYSVRRIEIITGGGIGCQDSGSDRARQDIPIRILQDGLRKKAVDGGRKIIVIGIEIDTRGVPLNNSQADCLSMA